MFCTAQFSVLTKSWCTPARAAQYESGGGCSVEVLNLPKTRYVDWDYFRGGGHFCICLFVLTHGPFDGHPAWLCPAMCVLPKRISVRLSQQDTLSSSQSR